MTEQEKREKVIKGLEHELQNRGKCGHYCRDGRETVSCEYDKDGLCIQHWGNDALALLKAQEQKCRECGEATSKAIQELQTKLKVQEPKPPIIKENSYGWKFYYCPSCGKEFYQNNKFNFCEKCGQAVKWE